MGSKGKRFIKLAGIIGGIYLAIRYILPLIVPFLFAALLAKCIWPPVRFLHRKWHVPETAGAAAVLIGAGVTFGLLFYWLGSSLLLQLQAFAGQVPRYLEELRQAVDGTCSDVERALSLRAGCIMEQLVILAQGAWNGIRQEAGVYLTRQLLPMASWFVEAGTMVIIIIVAAVYWIKEREDIKSYGELSVFRREIRLVLGHCSRVGGAYLKVELLIMVITAVICVFGLAILGNRYALLAGVCIGLLDALPFFGTGTVFMPWILLEVLQGDFVKAAGLLVIYLVCYFVREFMESRLLGERIGMTALETMASMYIGWQLFGLWGLFLGPVAWILIKEIDKYYNVY